MLLLYILMYLSFRSSTLKFENDTSRIPKIPFWVGSHGSFKCVFVTRSVVEQFSRSVTSGTVQNCFLLVGTICLCYVELLKTAFYWLMRDMELVTAIFYWLSG